MRNKLAGWSLLPCLLIGACTNQTAQPTVSPVASPVPSPVESVMVASASPSPEADRYQNALNAAAAARAVSQTALDKDDWALVAAQWQTSIKLLKAVPKDSTSYALAQKILPQYQQNLAQAQQKSTNFKQKAAVPDEPAPVASVDQSQSFSMPIIKKLNNIPVVEITINGSDRVQMLFDTGASKTLITKGTATKLQLASQGQTRAKTASGDAKFDTVKLNSVEFGQGRAENLMVAVGSDELNYGLLGHDVYKGYTFTVTEDAIEFKKR